MAKQKLLCRTWAADSLDVCIVYSVIIHNSDVQATPAVTERKLIKALYGATHSVAVNLKL
jgi:hypothetical protein